MDANPIMIVDPSGGNGIRKGEVVNLNDEDRIPPETGLVKESMISREEMAKKPQNIDWEIRVLNIAILSNEVYNADDPHFGDSTDEVLNPFGGESTGWKRSSLMDSAEFSNVVWSDADTGLETVLYEKTVDGITKYVYAFAGTEMSLTNMADLRTNKDQILGKKSPQYVQALSNAGLLHARLKDKLMFTGHSLGGGLASAASELTGLPAVVFNSAAISDTTREKFGLVRNDSDITVFTIRDEAITFYQNEIGLVASGSHIELEPITPYITYEEAEERIDNSDVPWLIKQEMRLMSRVKANKLYYKEYVEQQFANHSQLTSVIPTLMRNGY